MMHCYFILIVHRSTEFLIISSSFDFFCHVCILRIKFTLNNAIFLLTIFLRNMEGINTKGIESYEKIKVT